MLKLVCIAPGDMTTVLLVAEGGRVHLGGLVSRAREASTNLALVQDCAKFAVQGSTSTPQPKENAHCAQEDHFSLRMGAARAPHAPQAKQEQYSMRQGRWRHVLSTAFQALILLHPLSLQSKSTNQRYLPLVVSAHFIHMPTGP